MAQGDRVAAGMNWSEYGMQPLGSNIPGPPRPVRRIGREEAPRMTFEQTGRIDFAAVPLHGAPVSRNLAGAEAAEQLEEQYRTRWRPERLRGCERRSGCAGCATTV